MGKFNQVSTSTLLEAKEKTKPTQSEKSGLLQVKELYPVIYCGSGGGGINEYAASSDPNIANVHEINVFPPNQTTGKVIAAFYQPVHNIPALTFFALIDVIPHPTLSNEIELHVASWPGKDTRLRIKITVLYTI